MLSPHCPYRSAVTDIDVDSHVYSVTSDEVGRRSDDGAQLSRLLDLPLRPSASQTKRLSCRFSRSSAFSRGGSRRVVVVPSARAMGGSRRLAEVGPRRPQAPQVFLFAPLDSLQSLQ